MLKSNFSVLEWLAHTPATEWHGRISVIQNMNMSRPLIGQYILYEEIATKKM